MKTQATLFIVLISILSTSFKREPSFINFKTGRYGACNCSSESSPKLELAINEDNTFHYYDNYNPDRKIDIKGNWELKDDVIVLKNYKSETSIHNKWAIDKNEKCLKSRKGLNFTRLCHLEFCN